MKKGRVKFTSDQHTNWLADFSFAGNILDAADLVDPLETVEAGETLWIHADSVSGPSAAACSPFPVLAMCS